MTNNKEKKFWREKVTAEIGVVHVQSFAREMGSTLSADEVAEFLNRSGVAQNLWLHMMQAGEEYIKSHLKPKVMPLPQQPRATSETRMIQ